MAAQRQYLPLGSRSGSPKPSKYGDEASSSQGLMLEAQNTSYSRPQTPLSESKEDHYDMDDNPLTFRRAMVLIGMAFLWTSSQIPLYFYGGIQINVLKTIGGYSQYVWLGLGNLLPLAIVTPFVGNLSDLFGRKSLALAAFLFIIVGNAMCALAQSIQVYIPGTILIGTGAGIGELISLAVAAEIAPTKNRGLYIGAMVMTILPFCPSTLYAQLIAYSSTWRWVGLFVGVWSFIGLVLTFAFYWPPPTHRKVTRRELLRRIDWIGGFLSAAAICLILIGLTFPTEGIPWTDPRVLACLILGLCMTIGFVIWEKWFVKYPMFPARLKENHPRNLAIILLITFVSGANFFVVLIYWPTQYQNVYASDNPVSVGIGSLPVGFGIILGSMIVTALVSILKGKIRLLMIASSVFMAAGNGAMALARRDNLPVMWFVVSIACIGVGAVVVPNQVIAGIICPADLIATITAVTITVRIIGGSIGYAIYSVIFSLKFASETATTIVPAAIKAGINSTAEIEEIAVVLRGGGFDQLWLFPGIVEQSQVDALTVAGKEALVESYPVVYYASIGFGVICVIASFFLTGIEDQMKAETAVKLG